MPKSVCVKCEVELSPETNGVLVVEMYRNNTAIYRLWFADLWKCRVCGMEVVLGFADQPYMHDWEGGLAEKVEEFKNKGCRIIYDKERLITGGEDV